MQSSGKLPRESSSAADSLREFYVHKCPRCKAVREVGYIDREGKGKVLEGVQREIIDGKEVWVFECLCVGGCGNAG
jgi:hypothetical protein